MRTASVEIFSDQTNAAVMRHPGRQFPGVLIQGDTLYSLWQEADSVCREIGQGAPGHEEAGHLRDALQGLLNHYKTTLAEHGMSLPF